MTVPRNFYTDLKGVLQSMKAPFMGNKSTLFPADLFLQTAFGNVVYYAAAVQCTSSTPRTLKV
jgi:hypothetical protein